MAATDDGSPRELGAVRAGRPAASRAEPVRLDVISIRNLIVRSIVGLHEWERREPQDILVGVRAWCHVPDVSRTDRIADTVDYSWLAGQIIDCVQSVSPYTLEALAGRLIEVCFRDPRVHRIELKVEKPDVAPFGCSVGVEMTRDRDELA